MEKIEETVFICYRRTNASWAIAIAQYLTNNGYDVFFDFKTIKSGDFEQIIIENIKSRAHFLILLTPSALERCNEPEDWLRREIELALKYKRNIVPILLDGFDFGDPIINEYLSGDLKNIQKYNGINVYPDYFNEGMDRLCKDFLKIPLDKVTHPVLHSVSPKVQKFINIQKLDLEKLPPIEKKVLLAQRWFEKAVFSKDPEEKIRFYTRSIELNPEFSHAYNNRGNIYSKLNQFEMSKKDYDRAIKLNPKIAEVYSNRGTSFIELGKYDKAVKDFDKAISMNLEYAELYVNRGHAYSKLMQYEKATNDFNHAVKLNPNLDGAYFSRGNIYYKLKQYKNAIKDYDKAIKLNPEYYEAFGNRGNCYSELNQQSNAIKDFDYAIKINSGNEGGGVYFNRGLSYSLLNKFDKAIKDYDKAINLNPYYVEAYNNRGLSYFSLEQFEKAIKDFNQTIKLKPELDKAYFNRGSVYLRQKQYEKALNDYDQAIKLNPKDGGSYYNKACIYAILGKTIDSIKNLKQALEIDSKEFCELIKNENDFEQIRGDTGFQSLIKKFCDEC